MRVYRGKKYEDLNPVDLLPNDKYLVTTTEDIAVLARTVFNDTGTIRDCSPTNLDVGTQYTINYDRHVNDVNLENRIGVTHQIRI